MGQDLSLDCCVGNGRYKGTTINGDDNDEEADLRLAWEVEALESWENLDPITYYQYIEKRSKGEEERHRALRKMYLRQQKPTSKPKSYLQEVDECFDELLGIQADEPIVYEQSYEMTPLQATLEQRKNVARVAPIGGKNIPAGSYTTVGNESGRGSGSGNGSGNASSDASSGASSGASGGASNDGRLRAASSAMATSVPVDDSPAGGAAGGGSTKEQVLMSAPQSESQQTTASSKTAQVRQPFVSDDQRDLLLRQETDHSGWECTDSRKVTRHQLCVWQPKSLGWPPFKERKFKIVHIVKGSIDSVWKAWNDVELRKTYDPAYELANVVERVDDSCDGELLLVMHKYFSSSFFFFDPFFFVVASPNLAILLLFSFYSF